jgi:hypothetical protein
MGFRVFETANFAPEAVFLVMCDPSMNKLSDLDRPMHRSLCFLGGSQLIHRRVAHD